MSKGRKTQKGSKNKITKRENTEKDNDQNDIENSSSGKTKSYDDPKEPRLRHKPFEDKSRMPLGSDESPNDAFEIDGQ